MKKLKLFVFSLLLALTSTSLLLEDNYNVSAKLSDYEQSQNTQVSINNFSNEIITDSTMGKYKEIVTNLYGSGNETQNFYTIDITTNGVTDSTVTGSKNISDNNIYTSINASLASNNKSIIKAMTSFSIPNNYLIANNNGYLNMNLLATLNPASKQPDAHYAELSDGIQTVTSEKYKTNTNINLKIDTLQQNNIQVKFIAECGDVSLFNSKNELSVTNPQIIFRTNDITSPEIYDVTYDKEYSANEKVVTFKVRELESGLQFVRINGTNIQPNNDGLYSFTATQDQNYNIEVVDNVNNSNVLTISKESLKIDMTEVSTLTVSEISDTHDNYIEFYVNFVEDSHSPESVYYTLVSQSSYDEVSSLPNTLSQTLKKGYNIISLEDKQIGNYILSVVVIDAVGHTSNIVQRTFRFDDTRYAVNINAINGDYSIIGAEILDGETSYHAWYGDEVIINYYPYENYEFFNLYRDGKVENAEVNKYVFNCNSDINLEVKFRYRLNLINFTSEYNFDVNGNLKFEFELNNSLSENELQQIEIEYYNQENNITTFYNAGEYLVKWNIDTEDYIGFGVESVRILPKKINIIYGNYNDLVYDKNEKEISLSLSEENDLNEQEKNELKFDIQFYDNETIDFIPENQVELKNAGSYIAKVTCSDSNYQVLNDTLNITIAKKDVSVTTEKSEFNYTASNQQILFSLDDEIDVYIQYYQVLNDEETIVEFINAGVYKYVITPVDNINYNLLQNIGEAIINKVQVNFEIDKYIYDYSGNVVIPDYNMYDIDNNKINFVNNLKLNYYIDNNLVNEFKEPAIYKLIFVTDDENYILNNTEFELQIKKTIINVVFNTTEYEYTGGEICIDYVFFNENNEQLQGINNITLKLTFNGEIINEVKSVGTYTYYFETEDVNYQINGSTGTFSVIPAQVNIIMNNFSYEYNVGGYQIDYSIVTENGIDFSSNENIQLNIYQNGEITSITNVGVYDYSFVSSDSNITIISGANLDFENKIKVYQKTIYASVVNQYEYTGNSIDLIFEIENYYGLDSSLIICEYDEMLNVGDYNYTIWTQDENYIIEISNANIKDDQLFVSVIPKVVNIISLENEYVYTGNEIQLNIEFDLDIDYTINSFVNNQYSRLIDANTYNVYVLSCNDNYTISNGEVTIEILPKVVSVEINQDSLTKEYTKSQQGIELEIFVDGKQIDNLNYHVDYFNQENEKILPINVGVYNFSVIIDNKNYYGSATGEFSITQKSIDLIVLADQYKFYGDSNEEIQYYLNGLIDGDYIDVVLGREDGENVGVYKIKLLSAEHQNYKINFSDNYFYKIVAKNILVIADETHKTFGESDDLLTYKIFMNNQIVSELLNGDVLYGELQREIGEDVGKYEINLGTLGNNNYEITFVKNYLTIYPKQLNIIIDNVEVEYGKTSPLTYTVKGDYDSSLISGELQREPGENVGEYIISAGTLHSQNYELNIKNAIYKIVPKNIYVYANSSNKIYGEPDNLEFTVEGLLAGDELSGHLNREPGENVGVYRINKGTLNNPNYIINFEDNVLVIEKATLNITIDDKQQEYGKEQVELTYSIEGLKYNDSLDIKIFREAGNDVGQYQISCSFSPLENYIVGSLTTGLYTITKSTITPVLNSKTVVYSGNPYNLKVQNFPFNLRYVYKQNGFEVDQMINAGTYTVKAIFEGNNNYYASESNEATFVISKQLVYFTLSDNKFIYDGNIKYPEYYYDKTCGLNETSIVFEFENDINPINVGKYNFVLKVEDDNYKGETQGVIEIQKSFSVTNKDESIIECAEATFDDSIKEIKLVQNNDAKKFNDEKVVSICTLENIDKTADTGYIYTVKVKAIQGIDNVKVYKVGLNGFSELAIKVENGYYVFQVDDVNDKYIITTEIRSLSNLAWIIIIATIVITFSIILVIVSRRKHKKVSKEHEEDIDLYNLN